MLTNSVFQLSGQKNTKLVFTCFLFDVTFSDVFYDFFCQCQDLTNSLFEDLKWSRAPENEHIPMVGVHDIAGNKRMVPIF